MIKNGPIIVTEKLTKSFGEIVAVNQLTLSVNRGEVFGLLGPNNPNTSPRLTERVS